MSKKEVEVIVCKGCNNQKVLLGTELATSLIEKLKENIGKNTGEINVKPVSCMGACGSFCVVAFKSESKPTYIFGQLLPENTEEIVTLAQVYSQGKTGQIPWEARPVCLRNLLAVIPNTDN